MNKNNIKENEKIIPEQEAIELTDDELEQAAGGRGQPVKPSGCTPSGFPHNCGYAGNCRVIFPIVSGRIYHCRFELAEQVKE